MSSYWSQRAQKAQPYVPGEQPRERTFIKLNTNENPYPPSPRVLEAMEGVAANLRLYPDPVSLELREAAARRYGLESSQVFPGNGSDEVLGFAFGAFFDPQKEAVLFPDITYSFYPVYCQLWDIPYKTIALEEDFTIQPGPYLERSGGIVISNPNAPTGILLPLDELKQIAQAALESQRVFIVDEAYMAFSQSPSALSLIRDFPNVLVVKTLSKEYSLAGLRSGLALGSRELIEGLERIKDSFNSYPMDRLAQALSIAALEDIPYYEGITQKIIATRERCAARLKTLGFSVLPSGANFLFASPPQGCPLRGGDFYAALRERGILVRHFEKNRINDFLRITIGTDDEMDEFLRAAEEVARSK
ncbi:MAG: histidinol-phosphate transaminase [Treponema sp.]|nr:histidinol-phosphate transaminase [Treponema sp.]